jgi:hypothetical protein
MCANTLLWAGVIHALFLLINCTGSIPAQIYITHYKVPADGEANALGLRFVGTFRGDEASIRCMTARWELVVKDISHGIRA